MKFMCVLLSAALPLAPIIAPDLPPLFAPKPIFVNVYYVEEGVMRPAPIDEYLCGVVSAEMPADYAPDALMAQAVAARTYTLYKAANGGCLKHPGADICTDSAHCQAYRGRSNPSAHDAVYATGSAVVTYDGRLINALFHASSAGMTADVKEVFGGSAPYLASVASADDEQPTATVVTRAQLKSTYSLTAAPLSEQISVIARTQSGRVASIKMGVSILTGIEARRAFSLRSADFTLRFENDSVVFITIGYGHGVGLSQVGAELMAQNGATYEEILLHYYSGCEVGAFGG